MRLVEVQNFAIEQAPGGIELGLDAVGVRLEGFAGYEQLVSLCGH